MTNNTGDRNLDPNLGRGKQRGARRGDSPNQVRADVERSLKRYSRVEKVARRGRRARQ